MPFKSGQFSCHVPQHQGRTPAFHRKCNIVVHILKTKYSIYMNVKYESESTKPLCKVLMRKRQAAACLNGVDISPYRGKDHAASSARRSVQSHMKPQAAACLNGVDISPYRGKDHAASSARRSVQSHIYSAVLHQSPDKRGVPLPVKMVSQLTQTWHSQVRSFC